MPPLSLLVGGVVFQALVLRLDGDAVIRYGAFLNTVVNFVTALFAVFLVVRGVAAVQNLRRRETETEAAEALPLEVALLTEIRDLLAAGRSSAPPER